MKREIAPESMAAPVANYAHAIAVDGARRILHTSGVVPVAADGSVAATIVEQAEVIWANIGAILHDAGMTPEDIVSVTTYVVADVASDENLERVMAARDRALRGAHRASTLVTVPRLAQSAWLLEVAVVAAI